MQTHPADIVSQFKAFEQRIAIARRRFEMAKGLIAEIDLDAAIKGAAARIATDLNMDAALTMLARAAIMDPLRARLLAALETEMVGALESADADFRREHEVVLRAQGAIK